MPTELFQVKPLKKKTNPYETMVKKNFINPCVSEVDKKHIQPDAKFIETIDLFMRGGKHPQGRCMGIEECFNEFGGKP